MQNNRLILLSLILVGCGQQPKRVFVDLDQVALVRPQSIANTNLKPDVSATPDLTSRTIPGDSEKVVENLKAEEKTAIRREVEKETNEAIETISGRLQDYYAREIDDFYKAEFATLVPYKESLKAGYINGIRALFEESAKKRGPLLTRLTFLTEFPPPEALIPLEGKNMSASEKKRRAEVRDIQTAIAKIDEEYEIATRALEAKNAASIDKESERILARIATKQSEIDVRAATEASRLVRNFSTGLSQRIFSKYTFQLKEIPTKTVNFPKMAAQTDVPRVTFDRNQLIRNERADLTKELETFLSLNHYQRAVEADGVEDVTKEFIEWRTNLKSGHWESWQKSSTQK